MDISSVVASFVRALWTFKTIYDQHQANKCEIEELQKFFDTFSKLLPRLIEDIGKCQYNEGAKAALTEMQEQMCTAAQKLTEWSSKAGSRYFFRLLTNEDRMRDLQKLHQDVMRSMEQNLGLAELFLVIHTNQICENTEQMFKSAFKDALGPISTQKLREAKDVAVEARNKSTHVDEKFREDILGSIDSKINSPYGNPTLMELDQKIMDHHSPSQLYEDPLTCELFIDPMVASNGETYCRWTLIDKRISKNPSDQREELTILVDSLEKKRNLFRKHPEQFEIFQARRRSYRVQALNKVQKALKLEAEQLQAYMKYHPLTSPDPPSSVTSKTWQFKLWPFSSKAQKQAWPEIEHSALLQYE